ncbi:MAG: Tim44/TimA family putative adaptor protein [Alphaproteobacteria bacterium]|nr:Tim44/TimA family putative adaptor protein [Alphaproteobacteria bacterium]
MGVDGLPIDIIIFAAIAAFIVLRLRSVLGRRTGNERPPPVTFGRDREASRKDRDADKKVVNFPETTTRKTGMDLTYERAKPGSALELGLRQIKKADKTFNADEFLTGACAAFEMILEAFAAGDMEPVKTFVAADVYRNFEDAIASREESGETLENTIVGINKSDILEARMEGRNALLTTKFVSEQINVVRNSAGEVVDGEEDRVSEVTDIWTFMRDTQSRDPNWVLVETRSPN